MTNILIFANTANIDNKINSNKSAQKKEAKKKALAKRKIKTLASQISKQDNELKKLQNKITLLNNDISKHKDLLKKSEVTVKELKKSSYELKNEKNYQEKQIVETIIENFSATLALQLSNRNSIDALIDNEIYHILSEGSKDRLLKIDNNYMKVTLNRRAKQRSIDKISVYIQKREKKKKLLNALKNKHNKTLVSLESKHKLYQKELNKVLLKQHSLSSLLSNLNILKTKEIKKQDAKKRAKQRKAKLQKNLNNKYAKKIDLDVRILGSSTKGVKISKYRGKKTISPLKSYKVIKKFGKYYDPVYKIKLFNESVVLQTNKKKSKVYNILNGKIVYAKKNAGMLDNVVIVQHSGGLHTIYSQLDQISPTLRVGKWIKKGYVVGRVDDTLTFQATKNSYHINPKDLFN